MKIIGLITPFNAVIHKLRRLDWRPHRQPNIPRIIDVLGSHSDGNPTYPTDIFTSLPLFYSEAGMLENTQATNDKVEKMPSLNHSYICAQVMRQLLQDDSIQPMPELTLDIDNGLTPDISVFRKEKIQPNFFEDVLKVKEFPILAIEIISSSQSIQAILEKSKLLVKAGIRTVWTVEPYGRSIFVVSDQGKKLFHEDIVESEGIKVDFKKVFA